MADTAAPAQPTAEQVAATMRTKRFVVLLVLVAVIGVLVSLASWCFLELIYQIQRELFTHLPHALGYHSGAPLWWSLPVVGIGALLAALAITRLPGEGGHLPARGLAAGGSHNAMDLPGVLLAGLATIGCGLVLGPEAPLIALGAGLALLTMRIWRRETPPEVLVVIGAAGSFAAVSFIFGSPLIAAVILIEMAGIGGPRMPLVLLPGLLGAGIGSLTSIGMGSWTGLSTSAFALAPLSLPHFGHPDIAQFGWTIALAAAIALATRAIMLGGLGTYRLVARRMLLLLPVIGLVIAGLAIAFSQAADKSVNDVLFSGQAALPGLVAQAGSWSVSALAMLIAFKGAAYSLSLGSFRGGPTFPAVFLGVAAGILASHLPGYAMVPGVAVGIAAAAAAVLKLPLSAVVVATLMCTKAGAGDEPLIIVGVVVAYLVMLVVTAAPSAKQAAAERPVAQTTRTPAVAAPEPAAAEKR